VANYDFVYGVDIWRSNDNWVPVVLEDLTGGNSTGITHSDITVSYAREADSSQQTLAPSADNWKEKGLGQYMLMLPKASLATEGNYFYTVYKTDGTSKVFRGGGRIKKRQYEVFSALAYDAATTTLKMAMWLHMDGQLVTGTGLTAARCTIYAGGESSALVDVSFTSSDRYNTEHFYKTITATLSADTPYIVKCKITYDSVDYYSIDGGVTFN
jgi:hypothetical protein